MLGALGTAATVFQWHGRSFALPEVDEAVVRRWLANPANASELRDAGLPHDAAAIEGRTAELARAIQQRSEPLFERFLNLVGRPARKVVLRSREFG